MTKLSLPIALLFGGLACTGDSGLTLEPMNNIAVTAGDFDQIGEPLNRLVIPYTTYDGIISVPTWDPSFSHEDVTLKVEQLFQNGGELKAFDAVFIASGTRGFGERQYNGLNPDNQLATDPEVASAFNSYIRGGGRALISDWSYDLIERTWPDMIDFINSNTRLDAAQVGRIGDVLAQVSDPQLAELLGAQTIPIRYDYSNWAVISDVSSDAEVLLRADIEYTANGAAQTLFDAPLMVRFKHGGGTVVFTTFHIDAQNSGVIDLLISGSIGDLSGSGPTGVQF